MSTPSKERQVRVRELFELALQMRDDERTEYLKWACRGDEALRSETERLLSDHDDLGVFMDSEELPHPSEVHTEAIDPPPEAAELVEKSRPGGLVGKKIGQYTIKRLIASGGMGSVYEAMQERPRRPVALKVMRSGITSRTALRRFEYEAQLLARLRHPGICDIHEAGIHYEESIQEGGGGIPYFAMEYIPNAKPITEYVENRKLGIRERLQLFLKVCDAVHHGHQKGIIHRDLKPGNILVDSHGNLKVIDFGVARATDSDMAVTTLQTDVGQLIGTLAYMSPEQFDADPLDLDTRSDVYALGVLLYEMLCRQLPHDVRHAMIHEAALLRHAAKTIAAAVGSEDQQAVALMSRSYGLCLSAMQSFEDAEQTLARSHGNYSRVTGPSSELTCAVALDLADLYEAWNRPEEATIWRERGTPLDNPGR